MNSLVKLVFRSVGLLVVVCLLGACAVQKRFEGVSNTFLKDVDIKSKRENLPFEHAWTNPNFKKSSYTAVYFKPVRIDLLPKDSWMESASPFIESQQDFIQKAREIADYFHSELVSKTSQSEQRRMTVAERPAANTLVIEIALTELELSHPIARAGAMVSPVPGTGAAVSAVSDPHVAFAARVTDGASGTLVATAADRKFAPARIIDVNKLTVSSSAREIVSLWADSISAALQSDGFTKIEGKSYDWKPW